MDTRKISDSSHKYLRSNSRSKNPENTIPSLGNTALEVYNNALKINTAGFNLVFESVFDGKYLYNSLDNVIRKEEYIGRIPVMGKKVSDEFIINLISRGEIGIFVIGNTFRKEYHRATGKKIPKE